MLSSVTDDEAFDVIWEGPTLEGQILAARLERALVPVELDAAAEPGRTRITVPRSYVDEAYEAIESASHSLVPDTPAELIDPPAPSPLLGLFRSRLVIALVAALLVLAIILTYR